MSNKQIEIEVQAPGKNFAFSKEAIKCGADSVYIGAPKFSMRYEYCNGLEDIKKLVEYAHRYWAKVYIPINTLLYTDEDLENMGKLIWELYEIGVDAIIIQDIGILELDLPPIPVFLSTNTACFTKEVIDFYKQVGVYRVILPREMTYNEIREITSYTDIDIETFCYGFLCVGYSGKCYMAYVENLSQGKSVEYSHYHDSNHGVCTEPCMNYYDLYDAEGNLIVDNDRLLNLKFLNLADETIKLVDAGVYSFKIAGREKDLKHVKNSVANYNLIANDVVSKRKNVKRASSGKVILGFEPDFSKNFSKGFTDFFFYGRKPELYSDYSLVGTKVGKVIESKDNTFKLDSDVKLSVGDKLRYKIGDERVQGIEIISADGDLYSYKGEAKDLSGLELYRYIYSEGFKEVEESVNYRVIPVEVSINEIDGKYTVEATDEDKNLIKIEYPKGHNLIKKSEVTQAFYKLSDEWEFLIENVDTDNDIFIDDIDNFVDKVFGLLREERAKNRPIMKGQVVKNNYPYPYKKLSYLDNVTNNYTERFFRRHGVEEIETALENTDDLEGKRVFNSRYCLKYELGYCSKNGIQDIPKEPWTLVNKVNSNRFKVECDCKKCEMHLYYKKD